MPYLGTAQQWLQQSTLLLQARPSTTRITTKYTITPPKSASPKPNKIKSEPTSTSTDTTSITPSAPPPATLILKTYDPASGVTLKYSTNKAAEISRLIQILGRLARPMAGLPEMKEDVPMVKSEFGAEVPEGSGPGTLAGEAVSSVVGGGKAGGQQQGGAQGGQGGKKGKKKGKK